MPPQFSTRIDPDDVLHHPENWEEIPEWQARNRSNFVPVVVVTDKGSPHPHALLLPPFGMLGTGTTTLDEHPHFYSQIGRNHLPSAVSSVARWMDVSKEYLGFIKGWENPAEMGWEKPFYTHPAVTKNLYFAYDDGYGNPTIGYGHLCVSTKEFPDGITKQQVEDLLIADSEKKAAAVRKMLKVGVSQQQFDAIVDIYYTTNFKGGPLPLRALNAYTVVKKTDFTDYSLVNGKPSKGLMKRRVQEWNMFNDGVYNSDH